MRAFSPWRLVKVLLLGCAALVCFKLILLSRGVYLTTRLSQSSAKCQFCLLPTDHIGDEGSISQTRVHQPRQHQDTEQAIQRHHLNIIDMRNTPQYIPLVFKSNATCPGLTVREARSSFKFQPVRHSHAFLYSAYQDDGGNVTLVALTQEPRGKGQKLYCQLWHRKPRENGGDVLSAVDAVVEYINEAHGRRYTAAFIKCPVNDSSSVVAVSIVAGHKCEPSPTTLPPLKVITPPPKGERLKSEFTVCVSPLNMRFNRADQLMEVVEFNKLLGADKLIFYNYSIGDNVNKVLQLYQSSGDVDVLPWSLPVHVGPRAKDEIWYFGQLAALNDCLLRYRFRSRYLVFTDLDEFIVPVKDDGWADLVARLQPPSLGSQDSVGVKNDTLTHAHHQRRLESRNKTKAFIFRCTFFRKEWPKPLQEFASEALKFNSSVLSYTMREKLILPGGSRSKMIVDPRDVQEIGVHQPWRSGRVKVVPKSLGMLHHYRSWERPDQRIELVNSSYAAARFGPRLVARLEKARGRLSGVLV